MQDIADNCVISHKRWGGPRVALLGPCFAEEAQTTDSSEGSKRLEDWRTGERR